MIKKIIIALVAFVAVTAGGDYKYLQWSDNTVEEKWGFLENAYACAEYDMPEGYNLVEEIKAYLTPGYYISFVIFDYTRQRVYLKTIFTEREGWWSVKPYWVSSTRNYFWVGLMWATKDKPGLGVDTDPPQHRDKMWINQYGNWTHPSSYADFMIGVTVTNTATVAATSLGRVKAMYW